MTDRSSKYLQMTKINVTENLECVLGRIENIVGKGENASYQYLLSFSQNVLNFQGC